MATALNKIPAGFIPTILDAEQFAHKIEEYVDRDGNLLRPDYKVIVFTEQGWNIDEEDKKYIQEVETVFIYNNNVQTYICSITPNFWLIQCEYRVVLTEAGKELEETDDILLDRIRSKYEYPQGVDTTDDYFTVSNIEAILEGYKKDPEKGFHYGEVGDPLEGFNYTDTEYLDWLDDKSNDLEDCARESVTTGGLTWGFNKKTEAD